MACCQRDDHLARINDIILVSQPLCLPLKSERKALVFCDSESGPVGFGQIFAPVRVARIARLAEEVSRNHRIHRHCRPSCVSAAQVTACSSLPSFASPFI